MQELQAHYAGTYIDTTVFVYQLDAAAPSTHAIAGQIVRDALHTQLGIPAESLIRAG